MTMKQRPAKSSRRSIRRHIFAGTALVAIIAGGVGGWTATTEISGAIIAAGAIVVDSNVKKVQHPTGGVVSEIRVRNGDKVVAGDIVVQLEATVAKASLAIIVKRLAELKTRQARLWAERDAETDMARPPELGTFPGEPSDTADSVMLDRIFMAERRLFELRRNARIGQQQQLRERKSQLASEVEGLTAQVDAKSQEIILIQRELDGARELWQKKLMSISRMTALEREATRLAGEHAQLKTAIAATRGRIAETELKVIQIDRDLASEVARELREIDATTGELVERRIAALDQFQRLTVRAPQSGTVHHLKAHTVGGVVGPADPIMLIVPGADKLTVEVRIAPRDIDQLHLNQRTSLRFPAFNQHMTPEIDGHVVSIAADISQDESTGNSYYGVRIALSAAETSRLGDVTLIPGMPVEAFIKTGDRTVFSFLMKPLADQINRSFREI